MALFLGRYGFRSLAEPLGGDEVHKPVNEFGGNQAVHFGIHFLQVRGVGQQGVVLDVGEGRQGGFFPAVPGVVEQQRRTVVNEP